MRSDVSGRENVTYLNFSYTFGFKDLKCVKIIMQTVVRELNDMVFDGLHF